MRETVSARLAQQQTMVIPSFLSLPLLFPGFRVLTTALDGDERCCGEEEDIFKMPKIPSFFSRECVKSVVSSAINFLYIF